MLRKQIHDEGTEKESLLGKIEQEKKIILGCKELRTSYNKENVAYEKLKEDD